MLSTISCTITAIFSATRVAIMVRIRSVKSDRAVVSLLILSDRWKRKRQARPLINDMVKSSFLSIQSGGTES